MADVLLDTPIAAWGIPSALLMVEPLSCAAYSRLSVSVSAAQSWWSGRPVTTVDLPPQGPCASRDAAGQWDVPLGLLVVGGPTQGLLTGQHAVNAAHVDHLQHQLAGRSPGVPWGPLWLAQDGATLWIVDGNHRVAAAVAAGRRTHPACVVDLAGLRDCPCGWSGGPGSWLTHECRSRPADTWTAGL